MRGSYAEVQDYRLVGPGRGAWEKEKVYFWRCRPCCMGLGLCIALACLLVVVVIVSPESEDGQKIVVDNGRIGRDHPPVMINTAAPVPIGGRIVTLAPYDCQDAYFNWVQAWSDEKKHFCCTHLGRGCAPPPSPQPPTIAFDCHAGLANWVTGWSMAKKHWCCAEHNIACHLPTKPPEPYNCSADAETWSSSWDSDKKAWCCDNHNVGCEPFDCDANLSDWMNVWSDHKMLWCCKHYSRGCLAQVQSPVPVPVPAPSPPTPPPVIIRITSPPTTSKPFDCAAGMAHWEHGWSSVKKQWCCAHHDRGCPPGTTSSQPYECDVDFSSCYQCLELQWSTEKREWCCDHRGVGCPTTSTSLPFDCEAGLVHASRGWSPAKKEWCCKNKDAGCPRDSEDDQEKVEEG